MSNGTYKPPFPKNEKVLNYSPNSQERSDIIHALNEGRNKQVDVPMFIGGKEVRTEKTRTMSPPHDHQHVLGKFHVGDASHVNQAINASLVAKKEWSNLNWEQRSSIFLKAADLLSGPYRSKINAATMLGQSKNVYQAEIDSACEFIDFLRYNVHFMKEIYEEQPVSSDGVWNRVEYRALEGFIFAITPFNFTAIAGNLPISAVLMGNTAIWKPAFTQIYSANVIMEVLRVAGLPAGVINLIFVDGPTAGNVIFKHPSFAGLHFTGSTKVFKQLWKTIGNNIDVYNTYPRIVGETGGKDFIVAHHTAVPKEVATAITRGAFEYQGQKCSAASRVYIADTIWNKTKESLLEQLSSIKMGPTEDFENFVNAVIDKTSFDKITHFIEDAKNNKMNEIIFGGGYDDSVGYFIEPTVIVTKDPSSTTMCEEIFGPVVTIYVYQADKFDDTLELVDKTSNYALTGSVIATDRYAVDNALKKLENAAGNFYINDKPTGAVVGQQPFGGSRGSGTNDKAGSKLNLLRWVSPRTIKETFVPPTNYKYPFLDKEES